MTLYSPVGCLDPFCLFDSHRRAGKRIATHREPGAASVCDLVCIFSVLFEADAAFLAISELSHACPGALQGVLVLFPLSLLTTPAHCRWHKQNRFIARAEL